MLREAVAGQIYSLYLKSKGDETIITIKGKSMYPALQDGWKVRVKLSDVKEISCGDIVVFFQKGLVCHRIIGKFGWNKKLYFIQSGDSEIIGRVFKHKDLVGKVVEVSDADGNKIDERIWKRSFDSLIKLRLLGYIYIPLYLIKRLFFGKKQNRFTHWIRKTFWRFYFYTPS